MKISFIFGVKHKKHQKDNEQSRVFISFGKIWNCYLMKISQISFLFLVPTVHIKEMSPINVRVLRILHTTHSPKRILLGTHFTLLGWHKCALIITFPMTTRTFTRTPPSPSPTRRNFWRRNSGVIARPPQTICTASWFHSDPPAPAPGTAAGSRISFPAMDDSPFWCYIWLKYSAAATQGRSNEAKR